MAVTETETISWGSRLGSSIKGVLGGLALFILGFPLLFWNENRAVTATKTNEEGAASVQEVAADAIDPDNEGKLIHVTGLATTTDTLTDDEYAVVATNAIRLSRTVEMYQWVENASTREEKKLGGKIEKTTTYTYERKWLPSAVNSGAFKEETGHVNPPASRELGTKSLYAQNVTLGVRTLNESQIKSIGQSKKFLEKYKAVTATEFIEASSSQMAPSVGDVRVRFEVIEPHVITVVAAQKGEGFANYIAKSTKKKISHVMDGEKSAEEVFEAAEQANTILTWILRLVGFLMMYGGVKAVLKPLVVLGDVVPFIGSIIDIGTGLVAFVVAAPCALVTIAIAWLVFRPVIGLTILALAGAIVFLVWKKRKAKKAASVPAPAAPAA